MNVNEIEKFIDIGYVLLSRILMRKIENHEKLHKIDFEIMQIILKKFIVSMGYDFTDFKELEKKYDNYSYKTIK